ncbi:MAG: RagB/SusD family nutrient uptake outer membrane protein [Tannerellaceae bacterium]|nr:RagB/SusD family nutrient uptake outer membrane protein [Tannerellaceae bacterium]
MKNIFYPLLTATCLFTTVSCSDFLEENLRGQVVGDEILTTQVGLESALTGAYRGWASCWEYGFNNGWATEMTLGGDDLTCPPGTGNTQEYDRLRVLNTNTSAPTVYWGCYKAIQGANNVINNYENTEGDANIIRVIAGEAHFIRAASYFWLVRCFGELPLITTAEFTTEMLTVTTSSVREIYDLIEYDLEQAEAMLNDSKRDDGRPNRGSAKAMLAEVYLQEAGWPLKEEGKYAMAAAKAKEVIDERARYGFDLEASHEILYENDETKSGINAEDIFVIPCNKNAGSTTNAMYGYWAYPGEIGGWDVVFSELTFFREFPEGPRKDATFALDFRSQDGANYWTWEELQYKRPYYKKLMKNEDAPNFYAFDSSIPMSMLRYTQTVLTYAEAKARSGGPDALAYECLNAIESRAGTPLSSGLSADAFAKKVVDERAWELCGERVRWFDMVRLEIVAEVFAKRDPEDNPALGDPNSRECYQFPIPEHDVLLNSNLGK